MTGHLGQVVNIELGNAPQVREHSSQLRERPPTDHIISPDVAIQSLVNDLLVVRVPTVSPKRVSWIENIPSLSFGKQPPKYEVEKDGRKEDARRPACPTSFCVRN